MSILKRLNNWLYGKEPPKQEPQPNEPDLFITGWELKVSLRRTSGYWSALPYGYPLLSPETWEDIDRQLKAYNQQFEHDQT